MIFTRISFSANISFFFILYWTFGHCEHSEMSSTGLDPTPEYDYQEISQEPFVQSKLSKESTQSVFESTTDSIDILNSVASHPADTDSVFDTETTTNFEINESDDNVMRVSRKPNLPSETDRFEVNCGLHVQVNESRLSSLLFQIDQLKEIDSSLLSLFFALLKLHRYHMRKKSKMRECFVSITERIDDVMRRIESGTDVQKQLFLFEHNFKDLHYTVDSIKNVILFHDKNTRKIAKQHCRTRNPLKTIEELNKKASTSPKLFIELISAVGHNENIFNEYSSALLFQSGLNAILAEKCDKLVNRNVTSFMQQYLRRKLEINLNNINEEIISARNHLRATYRTPAVTDIQRALEFANTNGFTKQRTVEHIYEQVSAKYPFRAWAIMMYDRVRLQATDIHFHEGPAENWHYVQSEHYTLIAHSADRQMNCTHFAQLFVNKMIRQIFPSQEEYQKFFVPSEHLGTSVDRLKELLIPLLLPQSYFISVVLYRPDLVASMEHNFHYFEHSIDPNTGNFAKTILLGWC